MVIGKKTRSDDCNRSDEIWAMSYSVIGGIISALSPPFSWKFRLFEREELTGSTQEQNRWLKTASGKAITRNCTAPEEKKRRKVCYTQQMTEVENLLRNLVTRSRIRRNGLKKIQLCNDIFTKNRISA